MKNLNFKFFKRGLDRVLSKSERKKEAREAKATKVKRRLKGFTIEPLMGPSRESLQVKSRQSKRDKLFIDAFFEITKKYPGEPRKNRRAMARALSKRRFRGEISQ